MISLRLLGMSWGVKTTCLEAPGVSLGGSGVSIGGVGSLRDIYIYISTIMMDFQASYVRLPPPPSNGNGSLWDARNFPMFSHGG